MSSFLLNVWRENGAYLRLADTKNSAIAVISTALFTAYFKYTFAVSVLDWSTLQQDVWQKKSTYEYLTLALLLLSAALAALSVVPTLSKRSIRTRLFLAIGTRIGLLAPPNADTTCVYFMDVARYRSQNDFSARLEKHLEIELTKENLEIAGQLWIVSRIAVAKYIQHIASLWFLITGILISLL